MNYKLHSNVLNRLQGGYVLMSTIIMGIVIGATGLAFMRWSSDEAIESTQTHAAMQAYYLAQTGVVEKGFTWLRTRLATELPNSEIVLPGKEVGDIGRYVDVRVNPLVASEGGGYFSSDKIYSVSSVGIVRVPFADGSVNGYKDVSRKAIMYVKLRSYSDYMYFTETEIDRFGFTVRFQAGDTLWGRVHSNYQIAIMGNPVFYDLVTTPADDFWRGNGYNPQFRGPDPLFGVPEVLFPTLAENLRACAGSAGTFIDIDGYNTSYFVEFQGGAFRYHAWNTGEPIDTSQNSHWISIPIVGSNFGCFFGGPVWLQGVVEGRCTIGSAYDIRIVNDIKYADAAPNGSVPSSSVNMLGIVSEADVKIANTPANGRENCNGGGRYNPNQAFCGIIITAAVVALHESFTFENQNDGGDSGYVCACNPDERGFIHLFGSVTQYRRGFVHRSTQGGTGYLKDYRYDNRFLINRPPCFFDATDNQGHALFDVVQWGQAVEDRNVLHGTENRFRFN